MKRSFQNLATRIAGDLVAFDKAQITKGIGGTVATSVQFRIGEPFSAARVIDGLESGIAVGPPGQQLADVLVQRDAGWMKLNQLVRERCL